MTFHEPVGQPHPDAKSRLNRAEMAVKAIRAAVVAESWETLPDKLDAYLSEQERFNLAGISLSGLHPKNAQEVVNVVQAAMVPEVPLGAKWMLEARDWAKFQHRDVLKAFMSACFEQLGDRDKAAFLKHVSK